MAVSYEVYRILEEELGKEKADKVVKVLEESLKVIEEKVKEQKPLLKAEIKDELKKELVTKEEFYGEMRSLRLELEKIIDKVEADLTNRINKVESDLGRRIDRVELLLKVLIGLVVVGLTLLNPAFVELLKTVFALK
ncbi:MAG: hypothetical protein ACK42C_03145 [Aquificaceae bacterium]|jgi:hypothetical protein|uniref:hypothetical protein n=1 Tax=Hydrogenobacter sp. Uz 6-8 TaxID=3384828 RepID=UPI0030B6F415